MVSFDLVPPLQYVGTDAYRRPWKETFAAFEGPIDYEVRDLEIKAGEGIAFSHSFNRMAGRTVHGEQTELWVRWTAGWERASNGWLVTHEQVSVPIDLETCHAVLDLTPG
ncbi:MAG: YybH family protein [Candidatus Limnocylindria bacterium]